MPCVRGVFAVGGRCSEQVFHTPRRQCCTRRRPSEAHNGFETMARRGAEKGAETDSLTEDQGSRGARRGRVRGGFRH
eukprot:2637709-Prymnesium_polylepis.1